MAPERFVRLVQILGRLTLIWPPEPNASGIETLINNCAWFFAAVVNTLCILIALLQLGRIDADPADLTKTLAVLAIMGDSFFHLVLVRRQWPRFEILVHEVTDFLRDAKTYEKVVCRKYVRRYLGHHTLLTFIFVATIAAFLGGQLTMKQEFSIDFWHDFDIHTDTKRVFIHFIQYVTTLQTMCLLSGDYMMIMLLWYSSAKLELLGEAMHHVHDPGELRECARSHERIISFVKETNLAIDLIVLKSLAAVSIVIICASLQIALHRTLEAVSQFLLIICASSVRLFGCAWAGDDLTEMASNLSWSIYQCPAIFKSVSLSHSASIIILTSKRPLVVTVLGRNLVLSLNFFTSYLYKVMSFFMTLRACIDRYV